MIVYYSAEEAAFLLMVHPTTVRRWVRQNRIDTIKILGKKGYRIPDYALNEFLNKNPEYAEAAEIRRYELVRRYIAVSKMAGEMFWSLSED